MKLGYYRDGVTSLLCSLVLARDIATYQAMLQTSGAETPATCYKAKLETIAPMQRPIDRRILLNGLLGTTAAGLASFVGGCSGTSDPGATGALPSGANADTGVGAAGVKVGLMLPLGAGAQIAAIAKSMQQAAELAIFERSNAGLQLIVKDDKGTPDGAKAAAEELVKAGVELIAGPLFARSVPAAASIARPANIPVIAFSNDPSVAAPGVYLLSFLAEVEIQRAIDYAVEQGRQTFAALLPNDAVGKASEPIFRAAVERRGRTVAFIEHYSVDQSGIVEPSRKLKEAFQDSEGQGRIDALFIPGAADTLPQISYLVGQARINTNRVKLIGTSGWDYPTVGRDSRLHGAWFAASDPRNWRDFSSRFSKAYGHMPPRLASLAFDAIDIASNFSAQPRGARFTAQNLTRTSGFSGVDGTVRFLPNGRNERGLAVLEVQKAGPVVIDSPSATMMPQTPLAGTAPIRASAGLNQ